MTFQANVKFDFEAQSAGELTIRSGDFITVTRQDVGEGWWEGQNVQGETGLFPESYVELVDSGGGPPDMPPPPLPSDVGGAWDSGGGGSAMMDYNTHVDNGISSYDSTNVMMQYANAPFDHQESQQSKDDFDSDWSQDEDQEKSSRKSMSREASVEPGGGGGGSCGGDRSLRGRLSSRGGGDTSSLDDVSRCDEDEYGASQDGNTKLSDDKLSVGGGKSKAVKSKSGFNFGFHRSNVDGYVMNTSKISQAIGEKYEISIGSFGPEWVPGGGGSSDSYTCTIEKSEKKGSKFAGIKSFVNYTIFASFNPSNKVDHRYKHFDWLHKRLQTKYPFIPLPPLPDKQIAGRFEEELVDYRKEILQLWVDAICKHPVLARCEVWMHFISSSEGKMLSRLQKRSGQPKHAIGKWDNYVSLNQETTAKGSKIYVSCTKEFCLALVK